MVSCSAASPASLEAELTCESARPLRSSQRITDLRDLHRWGRGVCGLERGRVWSIPVRASTHQPTHAHRQARTPAPPTSIAAAPPHSLPRLRTATPAARTASGLTRDLGSCRSNAVLAFTDGNKRIRGSQIASSARVTCTGGPRTVQVSYVWNCVRSRKNL